MVILRYLQTILGIVEPNIIKYIFIVQPLCGEYSVPSVKTISEGGKYVNIGYTGNNHPQQKASIFQVENTTSIQFITQEYCTNSGVNTFYWIID